MTTPPPERSPDLEWTEAGAPRSGRYGDVYFSKDDGLAESRAVFLTGCRLPEAWVGRSHFTVGELGFGTGLNIVALLDLWRRCGPRGSRLHVFTIEAHPLTRAEAERALSAWPEVAEISRALLDVWPRRTPGLHRIDLPGLSAVIDVAIGDVEWALDEWGGRADTWFLDGFSPALNPAMWSPTVMASIAAHSAPGARLATFTVAGGVRRGLSDVGFVVEKRPGYGRKRERLEAILPGKPPARSLPSVLVIGAGIAGASVVRALQAQGVDVTLIESETAGAGASGFEAALVTPRLDVGDVEIAGLYAQALERAGDLYGAITGAVTASGVLQLENASRDQARFLKIAEQPLWDGGMAVVDPNNARLRAGNTVDAGGLWMRDALAVRPATVLSAWLAEAPTVTGRVETLDYAEERWRALGPAGEVLGEADVVVLCGGWGNAQLLADDTLAPVRGQAEWSASVHPQAMAWGGYVAPGAAGMLFGATHDRGDESIDPRPVDLQRNLATLAARLPELAKMATSGSIRSRAAVRATTRDRLPVCGPAPGLAGVFVLGGLGSRGFCLAPLLGEHLAALITRTPSPLPFSFARRLAPDRSSLRPRPPEPMLASTSP